MKRILLFMLTLTLCLSACSANTEVSVEVSDEDVDVFTPAPLDNAMLVTFGDSLTALGTWGKTVAEKCNMRFFNGARGGITTAQGLDRFDAFVASREPDYVTLCFGMNDLIMTETDKPRVTPEQFEKNLTEMVNRVKALDAVPILMTTNPLDVKVFFQSQGQDPAMYTGRDILAWLDTYNEVTRKVAKDTATHLADCRTACDEFTVNQVVVADGIHLSAKGNEVFANTLSELLLSSFVKSDSAPAVSLDQSVTLQSGEKASVAPTNEKLWFAEKGTMVIKGGDKLVIQNTNGLWPDAQCAFSEWYKVPVENSVLKVKLSTANVNTSIVMYFDGGYPHAYSEGQYVIINPKLGCQTDGYTGDILANQTIEKEIPLSELGIPASAIKDGYVIISGLKIYAAGNAYQPVTIEEMTVTVECLNDRVKLV